MSRWVNFDLLFMVLMYLVQIHSVETPPVLNHAVGSLWGALHAQIQPVGRTGYLSLHLCLSVL